MAVTRIENQAVILYEPDETMFNERNRECQDHGNYTQLVTCNDVTEVVFESESEEVDIEKDGTFAFEITGASTATTANSLEDSGADFIVDGALVGMWVRNIDDDTTAKVTTVSPTVLLLDTDIFLSSPENYSISNYELSGNIVFGTNELIKTNGAIASFRQDAILEPNILYKIEIDITSFTSFLSGGQIKVKIGGDTYFVMDETNSVTGTHVIYGKASGSDITAVEITTDRFIAATFTNFKVSKMSSIVYFVLDCDNDTVKYSSVIDDVLFSSISGQVKLSFDWGNLLDAYQCVNGCYYISIVDNVGIPESLEADRISNGNFSSSTDWEFGDDWTFTGSEARCESAGGAGSLAQRVLVVDFSNSLSYDVSFEVTAFSSFVGDFDVKLYKDSVEILDLGNITAIGSYTISTGVLTDNIDEVRFVSNPVGSQDYTIDDVTALLNVGDTSYDLRTECFELAASHNCDVKLSGTNLDNAFGIDFLGLNYNPFVRVRGELEFPKYGGRKEDEEDSDGVSKTLFYKSEKTHSLFLSKLPEYLHDFIRLLIGYDEFNIDDIGYIALSPEYEPSSSRYGGRISDLADVSFEVRKKTDKNTNKYC